MSMLSTDKWNEICLCCWKFISGDKGDNSEDLDKEDDNDSNNVDMSE